jgi:hypothetical protein
VTATMPRELAGAETLSAVLAARGDPLLVCRYLDWLAPFERVPMDAAVPLAMSGPHPRAVGSYGAECIGWARDTLRVTPRWWQALAITRQLEHDVDGALVWREVVESGPRRIGKSVRLRVSALWRLAHAERFGEQQLAMLVSKDLAVGKEIHRAAWRWAESHDWRVIRLNGAQEIEAPGDHRWLLRAPNAAYGYDVGYGQVDEAWGVDPQAITDGLEPALLERRSPQLHLTSTAHVRASSLMRRRLSAALRSADPDVLLLLWGAHPDADVADESTWRAASPHWTQERRGLIARKYAAASAGQNEPEFDDPDPLRGWAAQYLNVWPTLFGGSGGILPNWWQLGTEPPLDRVVRALGIAADVDQTWLSLGAVLAGDRPHLGSVLRERIAHEALFVAEVARIQGENNGAPVVIDKKGPAAFLIRALRDAGVTLVEVGLDEFIQATSDLVNGVEQGEVEHGDYDDLNAAVLAAGWRKVGDRRVFARRNGDISMLEAVALALHGAVGANYNVLDSFY